MKKQEIQAILEDFETWPADKQQLICRVLKWLQDEDDGGRDLTPEEEAELDQALAEADRKEFLTEEEMETFFDRFRR